MNDLIVEKSDILHDIIYEISEDAGDLHFPIFRVISFLEEEGYVFSGVESSKNSAILYRGDEKAVVGNNFIAFETLLLTDKEKYKQNFYKYLILRYKIFHQSALQNAKAAKINLIQNQRRTCVSNMYYSLHNSFASMVEYYKSELTDSLIIKEIENDYDDETKLEHFIPRGLKMFIENIDEIIAADKETYITDEKMNAGRVKSYENPFSWIYPLFSELTTKPDLLEIVESMDEAIDKINLENYAVDDSMRRSQFEQQLKENINAVKILIGSDECPQLKRSLLIISAFLAYGYMLRQSADYDSLFEIKIPHQDIINWTIITSNFLSIVTSFIKEDTSNSVDRIQKLDAASSTEILQSSDTEVKASIMTMTGIIIDKSLNLKQVIRHLNSKKGYSMVNQRGKISILVEQTDSICIRRLIFGTPLECYISFSKQGLFRIDVTHIDSKNYKDYYKGVNQFYLEQLIEKDIIERDLLQAVSNNATIVRGIPTTARFQSVNYLDLILGVHERLRFGFVHSVRRYLEKITEEKKTLELAIDCGFSMNKQALLRRRIYLRSIEMENIQRILIVRFYSISEDLTDSEHANMVKSIINELYEAFPEKDFFVELIPLSEYENRQIIEKNYSFFESTLEDLIEKYTRPIPDFVEGTVQEDGESFQDLKVLDEEKDIMFDEES